MCLENNCVIRVFTLTHKYAKTMDEREEKDGSQSSNIGDEEHSVVFKYSKTTEML